MPDDPHGTTALRRVVLEACGAGTAEIEELLPYGESHFGDPDPELSVELPLDPEPHVEAWREYAEAAARDGVVPELRRRLVQLAFPIGDDVAEWADYRAATRKATSVEGMESATGTSFESPERVRLLLHESPAGTIPVIVAGARADFVSLVQAIMRRNAPKPVPDSTGAYMVAGYNNTDRIRKLREAFESNPDSVGPWALEFKKILPQKHLYQDRFILLAEGPYSGVDSGPLGLPDEEWIEVSLRIRMEHECAHYFARRVFGSMKGIALDEVLADYMGIVGGLGRFEPSVLLHVLGLREDGTYREGGRLQNYLGDPPLSAGAFAVLQRIVCGAAENLGAFDATLTDVAREPAGCGYTLMALASLTLEEMAAPDGAERLARARRKVATSGRSGDGVTRPAGAPPS